MDVRLSNCAVLADQERCVSPYYGSISGPSYLSALLVIRGLMAAKAYNDTT